MKYQVVFNSCGYESVDYETTSLEQAQEVKSELQAQAYMMGERDFSYYIKEVKD